jgi:hypothetical protein
MRASQVLSALATFLAVSPCCFGQAGKAELFGAIQDPHGLATAHAKVTTEEQATGARFDVLTDGRGEYHLLGLAAGQYVLTVEKPGFRPYRQEGIALRIGDQIRLNVTLEYEALQMKLEKRFSRGLTFTFAYTFSKLIDDASTYFSQTIFTGPTLTTIGAADAFNRKLERDVSSGDIPRVFSAGWVYRIPRWWKINGWEIGGLVRVQSGDAVPVTQATNTLSAFGYAVQRPIRNR